MTTKLYLLLIAIFSRIYYLSLSYLASLAIPRYDKSTSLVITNSPFKFLLSWDAFHFYNIAHNGYKTEHATAFFPLYPYLVRIISQATHLDILTTGVLVSNICVVLSVFILYKLSLRRLSSSLSYLSCIFFLFNPASIIYSSMYSESLFTLLFLTAIHNLEMFRYIHAVAFLSLSMLCRANGLFFIVLVNFVHWPIFLLPMAVYQLYCLLLVSFKRLEFGLFLPYSHVQKIYWEQGLFRFYVLKNLPNVLVGGPFIFYSCCIIYLYMKHNQARILHILKNVCSYQKSIDSTGLLMTSDTAGSCDNGIANVKIKNRDDSINDEVATDENKENIADSEAANHKRVRKNEITGLEKFHEPAISIFNKARPPTIDELPKEEWNICKIDYFVLLLAMQTLMAIALIHWNMYYRFIAYNPLIYWSLAVLYERNYKARLVAGFFFGFSTAYAILFGTFYPPA